jgi:hypothetical protein
METFANPDVWTARGAALGTMVSYAVEGDVDGRSPDFLGEDRPLLRAVRDSPARVSSIRLLWEAGAQRVLEFDPAWGAGGRAQYDSLVITVSPKTVARADCLGVMKQWRHGIGFTQSPSMPRPRVEWLNYNVHCIMMWSTAPVRPAVSACD